MAPRPEDAAAALLERAGVAHLKPLLQREALMDVPLLRSMGAHTLLESLEHLGVEPAAATALAAALWPNLGWDEPVEGLRRSRGSRESRSDDEWELVQAGEGEEKEEEEGDELQLEDNGDDDDSDGPLLEENPHEEGEEEDELQLEDNGGDEGEASDDLMLEENVGEESGGSGGELCLELNEEAPAEYALSRASRGEGGDASPTPGQKKKPTHHARPPAKKATIC